MKIYKIIVDKKPEHCIACPLSHLHICGKENVVRPTSGAAYTEMIPDTKCKLKEGRR